MHAVLSILWFLAVGVVLLIQNEVARYQGLARMFPEGYRFWHTVVVWICIFAFAALVHWNPF